MILVDYTGVAIAAITANLNDLKYDDPSLFRHIILNSLKNIKSKFKKYGQFVLCLDRGSSWRREVFPYYKASRRKSREEDTNIDWTKIFEYINLVYEEIKENFSYVCIALNHVEADDILAVLSLNNPDEDHLIVTNDKDLAQLTVKSNIRVYSPMKQEFVNLDNAHRYLFEHIIRGDTSDGIPNIKSQEDSFVAKIRQKSVYAKEIDKWYSEGVPEEFKERFEINKKLISLTEIPQEIVDEINKTFDEYIIPKSKLLDYFIKFKLKNLMEDIREFL